MDYSGPNATHVRHASRRCKDCGERGLPRKNLSIRELGEWIDKESRELARIATRLSEHDLSRKEWGLFDELAARAEALRLVSKEI